MRIWQQHVAGLHICLLRENKIIREKSGDAVNPYYDMFAGKDPSSYIVRDNVMVNYPMGVITKGDDVQSDWAVAMAECLRDSDVQKKINETYPNVFEFYTSDDQVKE